MRPERSWFSAAANGSLGQAMAAIVAACIVWAAFVDLFIPMQLTIDGKPVSLPNGTRVSEIIEKKMVASPYGDLVSIKGKLIGRGRGGAPRVTIDGQSVPLSGMLYSGATILTSRGPDTRERMVTKVESVPPTVQMQGVGPETTLVQIGQPGLARVTRGVVSRGIAATTSLRPSTPTIYRCRPFPPNAKVVALTFDDGPWPGQTQPILDILKSENVHATFFMLGVCVQEYPYLARRVLAEGHIIGNHTQTHVILSSASAGSTVYQMTAGASTIRHFTGYQPKWFRAPGGALSSLARSEARTLGEGIIGWTVDTRDWTKPPARNILQAVINGVSPGAVILMHDGGGDRKQTIAALPTIIHKLKESGYRFVTLDDLYAGRAIPTDYGY